LRSFLKMPVRFFYLFLGNLALGTLSLGSTLPKLPIIQQVGVLPLQWSIQGQDNYGLEKARAVVQESFPQAVKLSSKFRVLNHDLVAAMWDNPEGRAELKEQFEIHGLMSLTVGRRDSAITMIVRLMNPEMASYLMESETVSANWMITASQKTLQSKVRDLVFRTLNRIPVDVSVTSVSGSFITLSGGMSQGMQAGDRIKLYRTMIATLHPANGTWLTFKQQPLGEAEVIDIKQYTSVAKVLDLNFEGAVEVQDGAVIQSIPGRNRFNQLAETQTDKEFKSAGDLETIIIPPLYQDQGAGEATSGKVGQGSSGASSDVKPDSEGPVVPQEDGFGISWNTFDMDNLTEKLFDDVTISAGAYWWSVVGPYDGAGKFPIWLVNNLGGSASRTVFYKLHFDFGGGLLFGSTAKGSYMGYDSHARFYWKDKINIGNPILNTWQAGGNGQFSGMNVSKEFFGGGDWIRGGAFGALGGSFGQQPTGKHYDWFGEFAISTLNIGRFGFADAHRVVESAFGYNIKLGAYEIDPDADMNFGAAFRLVQEKAALSGVAQRVTFNDYGLMLLAKIKM
jgi:hypothetical protein